MSQSSELAGGEGFTFESDATAFYLTALLAEAFAPGIDDRIVVRVSVQQRDFGEPLDDLIVDFQDTSKNLARLSLQVKRSLIISSAETNIDFREIVRDCWATRDKQGFRTNLDRYGAAVGSIAYEKFRTFRSICEWARESQSAEHFEARFSEGGNASKQARVVKTCIESLVGEIDTTRCNSAEIHEFLAHFVLIQFDFLAEGASAPSEAINRIRNCLSAEDVQKAPLVWARIVQIARAAAGKSGEIDRLRLLRAISSTAQLKPAVSMASDLDVLSATAKSCANQIPYDVGGTHIDRKWLLEELSSSLTKARIVQIRGLPGSGKSVLVRRAVEDALGEGPVLFLKAEQLEGKNFQSYSKNLGLTTSSLEQLLVEVGAVGTPILFIDAIDRIEKMQQAIVLDLMTAIADSPLLENWRVVMSLRDGGIESLQNWLGGALNRLSVSALDVGLLSDSEAETLAKAKPHLRQLLFGPTQVKDVVRRPFFAKILDQNYLAAPDFATAEPQSEVALLTHWWKRGGYDDTGQNAIERQQLLLSLAKMRAQQLSKPIRLSKLASISHIDNLINDGILQIATEGISVRFSHDIFFEWAFFYVLVESEQNWIGEITRCGEPPAVARVVELFSQWQYVYGENWSQYLAATEEPNIRSQWLRAYLLAPFGIAKFEEDQDKFSNEAFKEEFRLLKKALVWFQAEKTAPNANILGGQLPLHERLRYADLLGWPSDFASWRRLIEFLLKRIAEIPQTIYPDIVAVFEVWQNAASDIPNPVSRALLSQCASWLKSLDSLTVADAPDDNYVFWSEVKNRSDLKKTLAQILLMASKAMPSFSQEYLERVTKTPRIREDSFQEILIYSPIVASSHPAALRNLVFHFLKDILPEDQIAREKRERLEAKKWHKEILAKPDSERTYQEKMMLESAASLFIGSDFGHYDWDKLCIRDDYRSFSPASPLREPFHSLFKSSPNEALHLLRNLCNHAMAAWRQLHQYSHEQRGTPIPLEVEFPWGIQAFWGGNREYLFSRSMFAPASIGSGFMALEEWCISEIEKGRSADELIQQILHRNECVAILGTASMLTVLTNTVSEVTLPLITSQRLLAADENRLRQDFSSDANLIGFMHQSDLPHVELIKEANAREVRRTTLSSTIPSFVFAPSPIGEKACAAIVGFVENLPFEYEEDCENQAVRDSLMAKARELSELADKANYQAYHFEESTDLIQVVHTSPSRNLPENIAKAEEAERWLKVNNLWAWASKSLESGAIGDAHSVDSSIELARDVDSSDLFQQITEDQDDQSIEMKQGAVAATAAVVLCFRENIIQADLDWARDVLSRALHMKEKSDSMRFAGSVIPWHPMIFVSHGMAADLLAGTFAEDSAGNLLLLITHPLECVSIKAIEQAFRIWSVDPKFVWVALHLSLNLCSVPLSKYDTQNESVQPKEAVAKSIELCETEGDWAQLPMPPPAWAKVDSDSDDAHDNELSASNSLEQHDQWREPEVHWRSKFASEILKLVPVNEILLSDAKSTFLDFLGEMLEWTNQKNEPEWDKQGSGRRGSVDLLEWTDTLGSVLGKVAGHLPIGIYKAKLLDPILSLEDENCWSLMSPFTNSYVCKFVYDAPVVPDDAVELLQVCLTRFLESPIFQHGSYRAGEITGLDQSQLLRILMFVSVEHASLAARYVNGDWTDINRIVPIVDQFIRAAGWAGSVMHAYLTLCERSKETFPSKVFASHVLHVLLEDSDKLVGWRDTANAARIAGLVQHFSGRDAPLEIVLAQDYLRILDKLVDMGDRRSAALQLGEAFREIRLPTDR